MPPNHAKSPGNDTIIAIMARLGGTIAIREFLDQPEMASVSKRTLQRRLDHLIQEGELTTIGAGRGFKYLLAKNKITDR